MSPDAKLHGSQISTIIHLFLCLCFFFFFKSVSECTFYKTLQYSAWLDWFISLQTETLEVMRKHELFWSINRDDQMEKYCRYL